MFLWIHPVIQAVATLLAVYVLYMGIQRFRFQHMKVRCPFNWKRHVLLGKIVVALWGGGCLLGFYAAQTTWGSVNLTGDHYTGGLISLPLIAVAAISGLALENPRGKRSGLALFHGVTNLALFVLACFQIFSGVEAINLFLLQ